MNIILKDKIIIDESGRMPDSFYENETEIANTLIALSIIRHLVENGLVIQDEFEYILGKYGLERG